MEPGELDSGQRGQRRRARSSDSSSAGAATANPEVCRISGPSAVADHSRSLNESEADQRGRRRRSRCSDSELSEDGDGDSEGDLGRVSGGDSAGAATRLRRRR
ncbi:uncharacterized protein A4U43_C04F15730 [Asparagus officinalis]|uniref:Uncharacterized protein n=1 Tax=Asparagus officinalis TaxID=4686 RepID=A0A5P1F1N8_ASPOF|nr:uncharacterized protein A4U43_C04F15730 [Asparagus officinalis]